MKRTFLLLFGLQAILCSAQTSDSYVEIPQLKLVKTFKAEEVVGRFECQAGIFETMTMKLDSSGRFENYIHTCDGSALIDTGRWVSNGSQITLKIAKGKKYFDVLQFKDYYILVPSDQRMKFVRELKPVLTNLQESKKKDYDFVLYTLDKIQVIVYAKKNSAQH
jgi:hypothetical protein